MASLLRLNCVLTASIATLLRLWRSYCDPSAYLGPYKGRREDAQNAIYQDVEHRGERNKAWSRIGVIVEERNGTWLNLGHRGHRDRF
ncbi:hypothetical protein DPMN_166887 [Dreissena polymorpha]|uniref:Secreted protein n=1 Tax=Dreissena polymorpha TaxID=45954 RepID=A0A9D4EXQ8_DREPO|nr:hypothetical protein DPMN_166887 [Dreissena polymorpha]